MALILWLILVIAIVQVGMASHAVIVERREGLVPSTLRRGVSAGVAATLLAIVLYTSLAQAPPIENTRHVTMSATTRADLLRAQLAQLQREEARLRREIEVLAAEPDALVEAPPDPSTLTRPFVVPAWLALFALIVVGGGTFALFLLGRPSTLVPSSFAALWRRRRMPAQESLARAANAATEGRYDAAAEQLALIRLEQLEEFDLLDYLFLDAFVLYAQAVLPATPRPEKERSELMERAEAAIDRLLTRAPTMSEGHYLRARILAQRGDPLRALEAIRAAKPDLDAGINVRNDESVCLLRLAESELAGAKTVEAQGHFEEVRKLGVMTRAIPVAFLLSRLAEARRLLRVGKLREARAMTREVREMADLDADQRRAADVTCDAVELVALHRDGQHLEAQDAVQAFLARWLPRELPPVDHETAEEYLESALDVANLELPRPVLRGLFLLAAVCQVHLAAEAGQRPEPADVPSFAEPLLRALQIEPRQRDALACLGALYLAFDPARSAKALEWIDAALVMGLQSESLRRLQAVARREDDERRHLLGAFAVTARRFLIDPSIATQVRRALINELGRFTEFQPILLDLDQVSDRDATQPVTIDLLRERSVHLRARSNELSQRRGEAAKELTDLAGAYSEAVETLTKSADRVTALEGTIVGEMGKLVLR
jgi:tetratricopeptide (TPR) repeat protein